MDSAYSAMVRAIHDNATPHLVVLHYTGEWTIQNALLIPAFFLADSTIERRKPLGPSARRAGWVGCNILLNEIPPNGKIQLVTDGQPNSQAAVRSSFAAISELGRFAPVHRGWLIDLLRVVERIGPGEFTLAEVYGYSEELSALHPNNRNIHAKIRQQLQVLRDMRLLNFLGDGRYLLQRKNPGTK